MSLTFYKRNPINLNRGEREDLLDKYYALQDELRSPNGNERHSRIKNAASVPTRNAKSKWSDSITSMLNKEYGYDLDTSTRIGIGKRLFGKDFIGTMSQNREIYNFLYQHDNRTKVPVQYIDDTVDTNIEQDLFGTPVPDPRTGPWGNY